MFTNDRNPGYIYQLNAFDRWLDAHYLPPSAQLLWYRLMSLFNCCGWPQSVQIDNLRLTCLIGAGSEKAAIAARDALVQAGLLTCERGVKGSPSKYTPVYFGEGSVTECGTGSDRENGRENGRENDRENGRESAGHCADIYRQDIDKTRYKIKGSAVPAELCDAFTQYAQMRRKNRRPLTAAAQKMILSELEKLAPGDRQTQREILNRSIMHGWSGVFPLPATQKADDRPSASYDIEEMERRLLHGPIVYRKNTG